MAKLLKYISLNNHIIKLEKDKQLIFELYIAYDK